MITRFLSIITISLIGMSTLAMQSPEKVITQVSNPTGNPIIIMAITNPLTQGISAETAGIAYEYKSFVIPGWGNTTEPHMISEDILLNTNVRGDRNDEVVVIVGKKAPQFIDLSDIKPGKSLLAIDRDGNASIKNIA